MTTEGKSWGPKGGVAGTCLACGQPARSGRAFYCDEHNPKGQARPADEVETDNPYQSAEQRPGTPTEKPPETVTEKATEKARRLWGSTKGSTTAEKRPTVSHRRVSTTPFWGEVVEGIAGVAGRAGHAPVSRAMVWSSPVAGEIIEESSKNTFVDRLAQPLARNSAKWQDLFDLLGFWGAIAVAETNPLQAGNALVFARKRLVSLLPRIATNIRKQRQKEKEAVEAIAELMPDLADLFPDAPPGSDPLDLLLSALFTQPVATPEEPVGATA